MLLAKIIGAFRLAFRLGFKPVEIEAKDSLGSSLLHRFSDLFSDSNQKRLDVYDIGLREVKLL
jgi:hypothetical protein